MPQLNGFGIQLGVVPFACARHGRELQNDNAFRRPRSVESFNGTSADQILSIISSNGGRPLLLVILELHRIVNFNLDDHVGRHGVSLNSAIDSIALAASMRAPSARGGPEI